MRIKLNNVIKLDLTSDKWDRITKMNKIDGKMVFQFKLDGYTAVWLEKVGVYHRLVAYTKDGVNHIVGKFLNNISKANQENIFKMDSYPVPSGTEYRLFLESESKSKSLPSHPKPKSKFKSNRETEKDSVKKTLNKTEPLEVLSIDGILDKISKNGIDSLTNNEKRFLDEESKKI